MPLVTASPGTCPRWTSRDMAMDDRPSRAGVGGAAREPRACPGGWTPAASPPSLNLPTSPLFEQVCRRASDAPRSPEIARRGPEIARDSVRSPEIARRGPEIARDSARSPEIARRGPRLRISTSNSSRKKSRPSGHAASKEFDVARVSLCSRPVITHSSQATRLLSLPAKGPRPGGQGCRSLLQSAPVCSSLKQSDAV